MVVSAATGLFGMAKNVLDVWCNTTFLEEDGESEESMFWKRTETTKKEFLGKN